MNIPLISFFARASTWYLTTFMLLSNYAVLSKHALFWRQQSGLPDGTPGEWVAVTLYDVLGAVLYVPALTSVVVFTTFLILHLFFRETIDRDAHNGIYVSEWQTKLTPMQRCTLHMVARIGILIALCILCAGLARGAEPNQVARLQSAQLNPQSSISLNIAAATFERLRPRYEAIARMRANGVPASVLFCLHQRESSGNFRCHPHEGSPLTGRTKFVPKGRLPYPDPPYTFEQSAEDAYYVVDRLDLVNWKNAQAALQGIESFNGLGYQKFHPNTPSPYLWSGTSVYDRGKYTGDGRFDSMARDKQLGVVAILIRLKQSGTRLAWE